MKAWYIKFPRLIGVLLIIVSIPLLIWQAAPHHQVSLSQNSFLVMHSSFEMFSIIVAAMIFFTAYGEYDATRNARSVLLSYAALASGLFDMLHMLAYIGMPDLYNPNSAHKSILLWLYARGTIAAGLLIYVLMPDKGSASYTSRRLGLVFVIVSMLLLSAFTFRYINELPQMFIPGEGLTTLKIRLEWLLFFVYAATAGILYMRRHHVINCDVDRLLIALCLMAVGELFFTLYVRVSNTANLLGHVYKVLAYFYLYRAIYSETVRRPFKQIEHMLVHDTVTNLPNRCGFLNQLAQAMYRADSAKRKLIVLLLNLDNFHSVNAIFGHETGDMLLANVAKRIRASLPENIYLARFSGDEFAILFEHADVQTAERTGRKIQEQIARGFELDNDHVETGASLGLVVFPDDGDTSSTLLSHANLALHHAKQFGRNGLSVFNVDLSQSLERKVQLENGLRKALERQELSLHYQPKVDLVSGRIVGAEALLRWNSQELGDVSPMEFIPVAEETGQILSIGDWVMQEACRQIRNWYDKGLSVTGIAVNVSTRQFRQRDFVEKVGNVLQHCQVPAGMLEIEITESAIMDNIETAATMLRELSDLGVRVAIDDFGTGYSSLGYLKSFALHALKIDRSFIRDIPGEQDDELLVRMIINLATNLGLLVIAEGVELPEQLKYLRQCQCNQAQGHLFSEPLSVEEYEEILRFGKPLQQNLQKEMN